MAVMEQIGIFAGTFDPVHKGHIGFALAAIQECKLNKVYFLPERQPRGKHGVGDFTERATAIRRAITPYPALQILELDDAQFTIDTTLPQLQKQFASAHLSLLIGSDIACHSLPHWPGISMLLADLGIIVGVRGDSSAHAVKEAMERLGAANYAVIQSPHAHVSSSKIRQK